jgi:hypothetical protein
MARPLILVLDGEEYPVSIVKIDREKLYGKVDIEAFDEKGREAKLQVLAADGKTLIDKGGTALATLNDKGDSVERNELLPVTPDGDPIEQVPSSFNQKNVLSDAKIEDYFSQIVKSVYLVGTFGTNDISPLKSQVSDGRMYWFPFSWRGGIEYDNAYLIASGDDLFMVVGKQTSFEYVKLNQAAALDASEEEEISADDLDFDFL